MKILKLDHKSATDVLAGSKTSTWRLYDDKDLSVNDDLELLDKVDPGDPQTWKVIGIAHVDSVVQKRLGEVQEADYQGHERYPSEDAMLDYFRRIYGQQVDLGTPIKIIRFTFIPKGKKRSSKDNSTTVDLSEVKLYADGGSRGNPGPSASGYAIMDMQGNIVVKNGIYLGVTTNNQAEYRALKKGLEEAQAMKIGQVHVYMDSLLVVNQMLGIFKVKNRDLWPVHTAIRELLPSFKRVTFTHIPRELNKVADEQVNITLDAQTKQ